MTEEEQLLVDIAEHVLAHGKLEWGATETNTPEEHAANLLVSIQKTKEYFDQQEDKFVMHGVYKSDDTVMCHTGTSPTSALRARIMVGLWNRFYDELLEASDKQLEAEKNTDV